MKKKTLATAKKWIGRFSGVFIIVIISLLMMWGKLSYYFIGNLVAPVFEQQGFSNILERM